MGTVAKIGLEAEPLSMSCETGNGEEDMWDVWMILATIGFFALAIAYLYACEKMR